MEKIHKDDTCEYVRFICECKYPGHCMDVGLELGSITFDITIGCDCNTSFVQRVKRAWRVFRGNDVCLEDFILRGEDLSDLKTFLDGYKEIQNSRSETDQGKLAYGMDDKCTKSGI